MNYWIILIILALFVSCKQNKNDNHVDTSNSKYADSIANHITTYQRESLDTKLLDSLSKKINLPYGIKELVTTDFPDKWYCGGGYLEHSLKEEGLSTEDSVKYAMSYFKIIDFNKNDNVNIDLNKSAKLKDSSALQSINNFLINKGDDKQKKIQSKVSIFIKLPDFKGFKIYGMLGKGNHVFYNPIYVIVKNDIISDVLAAYEYSKSETLLNRSVYVDEDYVFNSRSFYNIDGYEVNSGELTSYQISDEGKFVAIK